MAAGPYVQQFFTPAILTFKNTLDWMSGDEDLLAASAKLMAAPSLVYPITPPKLSPEDTEEDLKRKDEEMRLARKHIQQEIQWTLTAGVPLAFVGLGLIRWRRRSLRQQQQA